MVAYLKKGDRISDYEKNESNKILPITKTGIVLSDCSVVYKEGVGYMPATLEDYQSSALSAVAGTHGMEFPGEEEL